MIELLLAAGLFAPWPALVQDHVWRIHGDHDCAHARYRATLRGTEQEFELTICATWKLAVASDAQQAAKAGLKPGDVVFDGAYNEEIGGPEGVLTLPSACRPIETDATPALSRPWPAVAPGATMTFTVPLPACEGTADYEAAITFTRMDDALAPFDAEAPPVPGEGCDDWRIVANGTRGFTPRDVRVCFDGSALTGTALDGPGAGERVLEGVIWGLDGSIEAAYTPPAAEGCAPRAYRVVGTQAPTVGFELEGFEPVFGEACALEGYEDVRLRFEPAGT